MTVKNVGETVKNRDFFPLIKTATQHARTEDIDRFQYFGWVFDPLLN